MTQKSRGPCFWGGFERETGGYPANGRPARGETGDSAPRPGWAVSHQRGRPKQRKPHLGAADRAGRGSSFSRGKKWWLGKPLGGLDQWFGGFEVLVLAEGPPKPMQTTN